MGLATDFARLIENAPHVQCPRCNIEMTIRNLVPKANSNEYTAEFRCHQCGTDTQREFSYDQPTE
jgi:transposase-like protein